MTESFLPKALWHSFATNTLNATSRKSSSRSSVRSIPTRRPTDMSLRNVAIVYKKELTEALRDRRTLIATIVVPLLMFPVMTVGFGGTMISLMKKAEKETPKVIVLGGADSPHVVADLKKLQGLQFVDSPANWKDRIVNKEVGVAVQIPDGFEANLAQQKPDTVKIYKYENEIKSEFAASNVEKALRN